MATSMRLFTHRRSAIAKVALVSSVMLTTQIASAAFQCNVQLTSVLVYADGSVNVNHTGRGDYTFICNLNSVYKGVPTSTCAAWTALLLQTKKANGILQFYYDTGTSCSTLPTYGNAPVPTYIGPV